MSEAAESAPGMEGAPEGAPEANGADVQSHWSEAVSAEYHPLLENKGWKTMDDALKSYSELERMTGNSIRLLSPEAAETERQAQIERFVKHYPEIAPRSAPEGDYSFSEIDGWQPDRNDDRELAEAARENGLTNEQADGIRKWLANRSMEVDKIAKSERDAEVNALRSEMGEAAFQQKLQEAQRMLKVMESDNPGLIERLQHYGATEDAVMMRWIMNIARRSAESPVREPGQYAGAMTRDEAKQKIEESQPWRNPDHPAHNQMHPGHEEARAERDRWYEIAYGQG